MNSQAEPADVIHKMQSLPVTEVLARPHLPIDVFVRIAGSKFVLVGKAGTRSDGLHRYRERALEQFFVRFEDFLGFVEDDILASAELGPAAHLENLQRAAGGVLREIYAIEFNQSVFEHARSVSVATLSLLAKAPKLNDLVFAIDELPADGAKHSLMTSALAAMIGLGHGWVKPATIEKLALGGFLHDIGKTKLPETLLTRPWKEMSESEQEMFCRHPELGAQILSQVREIPDDVLLIAREHHERSDGTGFPSGLRDFQISPLSRVVSLANRFADLLNARRIAEPNRPPARRARDAAELIMTQEGKAYNRDAQRALMRILPDVRIVGNLR